MTKGYIALFRSLHDHWLWPKNRPLTRLEAWIDILWEVNHSKNEKVTIGNKIFVCDRGESLNSLETWQRRWNWLSKKRVLLFLNMLKNDHMIETKNETVTTRLIVCNYDSYQNIGNAKETDGKRKGNGWETGGKSNNKDKEGLNNDNS